MASKRKQSLIKKLRNDILELQRAHAEREAILIEKGDALCSQIASQSLLIDTLCSFFPLKHPTRFDHSATPTGGMLPKLVLELILYRERNEGAVFQGGETIKMLREMMLCFINPDRASANGELERLKQQLKDRGVYVEGQ